MSFFRKKGSSSSPKSARKASPGRGRPSPTSSPRDPSSSSSSSSSPSSSGRSDDVLTNIVAARQGSGGGGKPGEGTDIWGYLYTEKNRKGGNKKKESSLIVEFDEDDDMIVKLEGFLNKKGEGLVASFKKRWFVFDIRNDPEKLYYYDSREQKRYFGDICLKSVYEIRRTGNHNEFEMLTEVRIYTFQADSHRDMMKWINQLSLFFGVQDLPSEDSDDNSYEANLLQGQLQIQNAPPPVLGGGGEGKDNGLNHFLTLPLSSRDRLLLRDVQTSAKGLLAHPRFTLFSSLDNENNNSRNNGGLEHPYINLSVELRDQNNGDKPIQIKCAQFDRVIGHGGLLFYVEILDKSAQDQIEGAAFKTLLCPGVWLLLRLCQKRKGKIVYMDAPSRDSTLFGVHDLHCKKCRLSRACDHPCKSVKGKKGGGGTGGGAEGGAGGGGKGEEGLGTSLELNVLLQFVSQEHEKVMKEKKRREQEAKEQEVGGEGQEEEEEDNTAYLHVTVLGMEHSGSLSKGFAIGAVEEKKKGGKGAGSTIKRKPVLSSNASVVSLSNSPRRNTIKNKQRPQQFNNRYPYNPYGSDWLFSLLSLRKSYRGDLPCFVFEQSSLSLTSSLSRAAISGLGEKPLLLVYFTFAKGETGEGRRAGALLGGLIESCRELFNLPLHVAHCEISLERGDEGEEGGEGEEDALLDNSVTCSIISPDNYEILQTSSTLKGVLRYFQSLKPSVLLSAFAFSSLSSSITQEGMNKIVTLLTGFLCQVDACSFVYVVNFSPLDYLNDSLSSAFSLRQNPPQQRQQQDKKRDKSYIFYSGLMGYLEGVLSNTRKSKPFQIVNLHYLEELGTSFSLKPSPFSLTSALPSPSMMSNSYSVPSLASLASSPSPSPPPSPSPSPSPSSPTTQRVGGEKSQPTLNSWKFNSSFSSSSGPSLPHSSSSPGPPPMSSSFPTFSSASPATPQRTHSPPSAPLPPSSSTPAPFPSPPSPLNFLSFFETAAVEADKEKSSQSSEPTLYFLSQILGKVVSNRDKYLSISSSATQWFSTRYVSADPSPSPTNSSLPPPRFLSPPSSSSLIGLKHLHSLLLPSSTRCLASIEIVVEKMSKIVDISFFLSQTIRELKEMVEEKMKEGGESLGRPLEEFKLMMKEPFHGLRDGDCAGAYVALVAKSASPLSLYLGLEKDALYCSVAQKRKFLVSELADHLPQRDESLVQIQSISAPEEFSLSLPSPNDEIAHSISHLKSLGAPSSCIVYEGLYGVGYRLVRCLVSLGVEKIIIFSRFCLAEKAEKRLRELKSVGNGTVIIHIRVEDKENFSATLDKYSSILSDVESVYFVDEDVFNFSLSKFSVKHTNTLLLLKTNFAQVLHEWSIQRESSLSQFVVISVFGADVSGTHSTPLSTSHHFYRHLVMRRVLSGLPSLWLRIASSFLPDLNHAFAYIFGRHLWHQKSGGPQGGQFFCPVVANTWSCVEKPTIAGAGATSWTNSQTSLSRIGVKGSRKSRTSSTMDGDVRGSVRAPLSRGMRSNKAFAASNPHLPKLMTQTSDVPSVLQKRSTFLMETAAQTCTPEKVGMLIMTIKDCLRKYGTKKEEVDSYSFDRFLNLNILQTNMIEANWQELKDKLSVLFLISITVKEITSQVVIGDIALLVIKKIQQKQENNTIELLGTPSSEIYQALQMETVRLTVNLFNSILPNPYQLPLKKIQTIAKSKLSQLSLIPPPNPSPSSPPIPPPRGPLLRPTDLMEVKEELSSSLSLILPGGKNFVEHCTFEQFINAILRQGVAGVGKADVQTLPPPQISRHVSMTNMAMAPGGGGAGGGVSPQRGLGGLGTRSRGASPRTSPRNSPGALGFGAEQRMGRVERDRS